MAMADPRTRLLCAVLLSMIIAFLPSLQAALCSFAVGCTALAVARVPIRSIRQRFQAVNFFLLFLWLIVPFTVPGEPLASWHFFTPTVQGVKFCLLITLKANALMAIFTAFFSDLSLYGLGAALHGLGCPSKLVLLFLLMESNVHLLKNQWQALFNAASLRGFVPRTSIFTYKTLAALLGILLLRGYDHAQKLHAALLLRGFTGHFAHMVPFRPARADFSLIVLTAIAACITISATYCNFYE